MVAPECTVCAYDCPERCAAYPMLPSAALVLGVVACVCCVFVPMSLFFLHLCLEVAREEGAADDNDATREVVRGVDIEEYESDPVVATVVVAEDEQEQSPPPYRACTS